MRAWLKQDGPYRAFATQEFVFQIGALRFITSAVDSAMLKSPQRIDADLYATFANELWLAVSKVCEYQSRFHYHSVGGGMRQSFLNVQICVFDRFLTSWPVQTDPRLRTIRDKFQPWWHEWEEWMKANRPSWLDTNT